jgi:hypothetical protein
VIHPPDRTPSFTSWDHRRRLAIRGDRRSLDRTPAFRGNPIAQERDKSRWKDVRRFIEAGTTFVHWHVGATQSVR